MRKILILLIGILPINLFAVYWITQYNGEVHDISFPDSLHGWAAMGGVGGGIFTNGRLMFTKDGGKSWTDTIIYPGKSKSLNTGLSLTRIAFVDSISGWAGGNWAAHVSNGTATGWLLLSTGDGFGTYGRQAEANSGSHYQSGGVGTMETVVDKLFWAYFEANLKSWDTYINGKAMPFATSIMSICFIDAYRGWVCCEKRLFGTTKGVDSLSLLYNFPMNDIDFIDSLHGWAVGDTGTILYTDNGGTDNVWDTLTSGVTNNLRCVKFIDSLNGWAGGERIIIRTRDGGQTWVTEYSADTTLKICAIDTNYVWALCPADYYNLAGSILRYHPYIGIEENSDFGRRSASGGNADLKIIKDKIFLSVPNNYYTNMEYPAQAVTLLTDIQLTIYDLCGRLKETLYSGTLTKGNYTFTPNIHKSGVYFVTLSTICHSERSEESNIIKQTQKLIILK
ncbi:MAG: YCF48-related protein [bacterium]